MSQEIKSQFQLEGRFAGFVEIDEGAPRRFLLECEGQRLSLKIAKDARASVPTQLPLGSELQVSGIAKWDVASGKCKRKVLSVCRDDSPKAAGSEQAKTSLRVIQVCTKGNCWKRGGELVWRMLERTLEQEGMKGQVRLEQVRCLGNCKNGPSIRDSEGCVCGGVDTFRVIDMMRNGINGNGQRADSSNTELPGLWDHKYPQASRDRRMELRRRRMS